MAATRPITSCPGVMGLWEHFRSTTACLLGGQRDTYHLQAGPEAATLNRRVRMTNTASLDFDKHLMPAGKL